jgi:hypothetical protein
MKIPLKKTIAKLSLIITIFAILFFLDHISLFRDLDIENINKNRIFVEVQVCTCPDFYVLKGSEFLKEYFKNDTTINTNWIYVEGNSPNFVEEEHKYILEGEIIGTRKVDGENVPVFNAKHWIMFDKTNILLNTDLLFLFIFFLIWLFLLIRNI